VHWALAGSRGEYSAGNGAAMRIAPLAFLMDPAKPADRTVIRDVCRITHHNDEAYIGALAVVIAIRLILADLWTPANSFLVAVAKAIPDSAVRDRITDLIPLKSHPADVASRFGASGYVVDTVPLALYCAQFIGEKPLSVVLAQAIEAGGDTDTIASITGQIAERSPGFLPIARNTSLKSSAAIASFGLPKVSRSFSPHLKDEAAVRELFHLTKERSNRVFHPEAGHSRSSSECARSNCNRRRSVRPLLDVCDFAFDESDLEILVDQDLLRPQIHGFLRIPELRLYLIHGLSHGNVYRRGWLLRLRSSRGLLLPALLSLPALRAAALRWITVYRQHLADGRFHIRGIRGFEVPFGELKRHCGFVICRRGHAVTRIAFDDREGDLLALQIDVQFCYVHPLARRQKPRAHILLKYSGHYVG